MGNTCRVDIYDDTYSGTAIELNKDVVNSPGCPAADPLVIEEDDNDNLLKVVRVKTGYIRLVEQSTGSLADLFAQRNDDLEVWAFLNAPDNVTPTTAGAGSYIFFHGFIEAQQFEDQYLDYRGTVNIPIRSMMGLMNDVPIGTTPVDIIDPTIMKNVFANAFTEYEYIYMPLIEYGTDDTNIMMLKMLDVALYPYNSDYDFGIAVDGVVPDVYAPISKQEFIERICYQFGMIAHDVGNSLMFTKVGFTGEYKRYTVSNLHLQLDAEGVMTSAGYGSTVNYLSSFNYASDRNRISRVNPLAKVREEWEEWKFPIVVDFTIGTRVNTNMQFTTLQYTGHNITSAYWSEAYSVTVNNSLRLIGDGEREYLLLNSLRSLNSYLFSVKMQSPRIRSGNLHIESDTGATGQLKISAKSGGKWYQFGTGMEIFGDTEVKQTLTFDEEHNCDQLLMMLDNQLEVFFYGEYSSPVTMRISEISYGTGQNDGRYTKANAGDHRFTTLDTSSDADETIDSTFKYYVFGSVPNPDFDYLGISQRNLSLSLFRNGSISEVALLMGKFGVTSTDTSNRVISTKYDVRDDIVTMQIMGNEYL